MSKHSTLEQIASDIYQVRIPLPFALNIVNCYLVRDGDEGWALFDTGIHWDAAYQAWSEVFSTLQLQPQDISRVILTHVHPDHFGMAGWFQQRASIAGRETEVYTSPREAHQARQVWQQESGIIFGDWLVTHGMPADMAREVQAGLDLNREMTMPHPQRLLPLNAGETLNIGTRYFKIYQAAGHSDGHLLFHDEGDALMLCGDHVLNKITPNIGIWTQTDPRPLSHFMASLRQLRELDVRLALPGHKTLIHNWRGRIDEILHHHDERLDLTLEAVREGKHNPYEVALRIFQSMRFTSHEWRFALAEAYAHLDCLEEQGRLTKVQAPSIYALA